MKPDGCAQRLLRVSRTVANLEKSAAFYIEALGFTRQREAVINDPAWASLMGLPNARAHSLILQLGNQELELLAFDPPGRAYPPDSRSTDLWFQHIAIVVSDMSAAYAHLSRQPFTVITKQGPQRLPPNTGSVSAFKFRDPDGHPVELIYFPPGTGNPVWQRSSSLFLGIDHAAIAVADVQRSIDFYTRVLGMRLTARSLNTGPEQARLDDALGVRVNVVALQPAIVGPLHVELLGYERPTGRPIPADMQSSDVAADRLILQVHGLSQIVETLKNEAMRFISPGAATLRGGRQAALIKDPTGHGLLLIET